VTPLDDSPASIAARNERAADRGAESGDVQAPDGSITTSQDGAVLTVTLNRPEQLNAQTPATWAALAGIGDSLDDAVRVVVVRGAGRSFSAGLDRSLFSTERGVPGGLGELAAMPPDLAQERIRGYQSGFRWLRSPGIVSIAAVQGHAIGAGAQLALACDLRVLTEDAQLRLPEATLGLVPDLTGTSTLVQLVGYSRALEMCLTGRAVRAAEAAAIGLANVVVPAGELDATVADLAAALTAPPVGASRATAALVRSAVRNGFEEQDAAERAAQVRRIGELARG
jgi:enoyl-CoA hydratase/carnithine racemase